MSKIPSDWKICELSEVAHVQTGIAKGKNYVNETVTLPYLRVANVQDGFIDLTEIKTIQVAKSEVKRYCVRPGDVLLTEGGDFDKLGRGHVWEGQIDPCVHQNHIFVVRANPEILRPEFLAALTSSPYGRRYFLSCAKQTTNLASINSTQLKAFPILLPPIWEQDKITQIIGCWNKAIEHTEKLISAKTRLKRGLMQQLLTGKKRFEEFKNQVWKRVKLGEVFQERSDSNFPNLELLAITSSNGVVKRSSLEKRDTSNPDKSIYLRILPGDIGYNTMRMWQGVSGLSQFEGIVSPAYTVCIPSDEIDGKFASHMFKHEPIIHLFRRYSQGLVDDTLSLKFKAFAQIKISLPPVEEQRRIAEVLGACDREIDLLRKQLDALRRQKRGLMQKLLTGRIRVRVDEQEKAR